MKNESREGFEVDAELVYKHGKKTFRQSLPIKVNSLDPNDIQPVIDYWRGVLKDAGDTRKLEVKEVYRVENVLKGYFS